MDKLNLFGEILLIKRKLTLGKILGSFLLAVPLGIWVGNRQFEKLVRIQISAIWKPDGKSLRILRFTGSVVNPEGEPYRSIRGQLDTRRGVGWIGEGTWLRSS